MHRGRFLPGIANVLLSLSSVVFREGESAEHVTALGV